MLSGKFRLASSISSAALNPLALLDSPDALLASFDLSLVIAARDFLTKYKGIDEVTLSAVVKNSKGEFEGSHISITRHNITAVVTDDVACDMTHFDLKAVLEKPLADLAA